MFWVQQKDRYLRQLLIRDIEEITGRRLIVYFANRYLPSDIDPRDVAIMPEILHDLHGAPTDLFLETTGGFTDATEGLVSLITNTISDLRVIVPNAAKSNGTLLCLAARSIMMGGASELGPIEPHLNGIPSTILNTPEIAAQNFPLHMSGRFALNQTRALATTLLQRGMMKNANPAAIDAAVAALSSREKYHSHGSVIDYREAKALGLEVEYLPPEEELWQRIWLLYSMYDFDSRQNGYVKVFEGRASSTAVAAPPNAS
ncbi:SDH family Clp fold serine proteinase [Labrys neptuniae]|uniref:Serine dehydrogenase proteinase n=1 Tax=Labrys neptuniae TaxID=376174 RepID=A0ABV3PIM8_9HYPH